MACVVNHLPPSFPGSQVVDLLAGALLAMGSQRAELAHGFSGALVVLARDAGAVAPVMSAITRWAQEADPSLIRHAVLQVVWALRCGVGWVAIGGAAQRCYNTQRSLDASDVCILNGHVRSLRSS
jgi:hypothetical protein